MTTKHTPGPWLIAEGAKTFVYALGPSKTNSFWASVQTAGKDQISEEEAMANAALIVAAPDLLAALIYAAICLDTDGNDPIVGAAIAKARGEA